MKRNRDSALVEDDKPVAFVPPTLDAIRRRDIELAADLYSRAHVSDPFARGRIVLHMRRGIALPSEVKAEAESALTARQHARTAHLK